jgi:MFS family permease
MELVDSQWRSLAYGAVSMAMGLGFGSTSLAGGYVIARAGYRTLFLLGVGLSMAGAVLMRALLRRQSSGFQSSVTLPIDLDRTSATESSPAENRTGPA